MANFENAGARVALSSSRRNWGAAVARVIESIGSNASDGLRGLEGGLFELRNALRHESA